MCCSRSEGSAKQPRGFGVKGGPFGQASLGRRERFRWIDAGRLARSREASGRGATRRGEPGRGRSGAPVAGAQARRVAQRLQGIAAIPRSFPPEGRRASICAVARRSPDVSCDRMAQLAQDLRLLLEDAADAGDRER
jgi:hypothetical protein